ncbi:hypothetical protein ACFSCX_06700 [Bacillus salitolerans]|uniref:Uncharacterized protein n=1 Tax=Bacillus salitolerans TaxID=1437434 RepID=A0ABW4LNI0_9BACI
MNKRTKSIILIMLFSCLVVFINTYHFEKIYATTDQLIGKHEGVSSSFNMYDTKTDYGSTNTQSGNISVGSVKIYKRPDNSYYGTFDITSNYYAYTSRTGTGQTKSFQAYVNVEVYINGYWNTVISKYSSLSGMTQSSFSFPSGTYSSNISTSTVDLLKDYPSAPVRYVVHGSTYSGSNDVGHYPISTSKNYTENSNKFFTFNNPPSINLTTSSNLYLSEVLDRNVFPLNGSVVDLDLGNELIIQYTIDGLAGHQNKIVP